MENKKFYWLKIKKDFFKRHDIWLMECMPNGKETVLLYIKLLVESIDHEGRLRFNDDIPYTEQMLASLFSMTLENLKAALKLMTEMELLKVEPDGTIVMTKFQDFVGCDTASAIQKRKQRNLPKLTNGSKRLNGNYIITPDGQSHFVDEKRYGGHGMQALDRAFGKCERCGSNAGICIHHNNGYSNELDDLVCLCASCHGTAHNKKNKGHLNIKREPYVCQVSAHCPPDVCQMSVQSIENRDKRLEIRDKSYMFIAPTLEDITAYCQERKSPVDPMKFFEYYEAGRWKDSKGNPVKNWKQKLITWERKETPRSSGNEFIDLLNDMEVEDEEV